MFHIETHYTICYTVTIIIQEILLLISYVIQFTWIVGMLLIILNAGASIASGTQVVSFTTLCTADSNGQCEGACVKL